MPEQAVYRVLLEPLPGTQPPAALQQAVRGTALLEGQAESLLRRAWRQIGAVLVRESGF